MRDFRGERPGGPNLNPVDDAIRADERMRAMRSGGAREPSRRLRLAIGWGVALLAVGFAAALLGGLVRLVPG